MKDEPVMIKFSHTFWIFGLGMGIASWLTNGDPKQALSLFIVGVGVWFFLIIIFAEPIETIINWFKKKGLM